MNDNNYPFNLIRAIYGDSKNNDDHIYTTYLKGLFEQIRLLDDKEQKCLSMRYKDGLTLKDCGKYYGTTGQSVRQIVNRALRKLRHRSRALHYEAVPRVEMKRLENQCQKVTEENQKLNEALHTMNSASIDPDVIILLANMLKPDHLTAHIGELKLSTRAYNALARASLFTVKDIIAIPENELILMRNLGEKTVQEIKAKIKAYVLLPEAYQLEQEELYESSPI